MKRWAGNYSVSAEEHFTSIDQNLWSETVTYSKKLKSKLLKKYTGEIPASDFNPDAGVGGAAALDILYFYARYACPQTVVETGVSAGWSSRAILEALHKNKKGTLYSNDLPYSERPSIKDTIHPTEEQIGILVDEELRSRWNLFIGPDKNNIPKIVSEVDTIDLFHYDSDKSYSGRSFAMEEVRPKLHDSSIIVMDDVTDNRYFHDFVQRESVQWEIVEPHSKEKPVGIIKGKW